MLLRLLVMLLVLQKLQELLLLLLLQHSQGLRIKLRSTLLGVLEVVGLWLLEGRVWRELEWHLWLRSTLAELRLLLLH